MTIYEIIYAIREGLRDYTDDTRYSDDYLVFQFNLKRNVLLRREYNQLQRSIDSELTSTICLDIELVDASECPECYPHEGCEVVRTVQSLPRLLELHSRPTITRVAPVGIYNKPFSLVSRSKALYVGESNYEKNIIYAFLNNDDKIYLKSTNKFVRTLDKIAVTILPENPLDLIEYKCLGDVNCFDPTTEKYPIKAWMADVVISMIIQELANIKQIPEDRTNNAKADV